MTILAASLQSGSNGNCIYVEAGGTRLLFDAGISGIQAERRLRRHGRDIRDVQALVISHDHADHVRCAGIYQRKYGFPVYMTRKTLSAAQRRVSLGRLDDVRFFRSGDTLAFGGAAVETIPTKHDGADGVAFVVTCGRRKLGILTDLGHLFEGLDRVVAALDAVFIESNYDPDMLDEGPYPPWLKRRIRGPGGHLSNEEAARLLFDHGRRLKWACLAHLSEENNRVAVALRTHRGIVGEGLALRVAGRYEETDLLEV